MATNSRSVRVIMMADKLNFPFLKDTPTDLLMKAILALFVLVAVVRYRFLGTIVSVPIAIWLVWPMLYSKRYYAMWERSVLEWWIRVVLEGYLWENKDHPLYEPREVAWWRRGLKAIVHLKHPFPYRVDWVGEVGLVYNMHTKTDTVIISADGSSIANLPMSEQDARLERMADEIQRIATVKGLHCRVSTSIKRRPYDMMDESDNRDVSLHPDVFVPRLLVRLKGFRNSLAEDLSFEEIVAALRGEALRLYTAGEVSARDLRNFRLYLTSQEAREIVMRIGAHLPMTVMVTLPRSSRLAAAADTNAKRRRPLEESELVRQSVVRLARNFCAQVEQAGVHKPRVLNREQAEDYIASSIFVSTLDTYRQRAMAVRTGEAQSPGKVPIYHPQVSMRVTNDTLIIDGDGHAAVQLTSPPRVGTDGETVSGVIPTTLPSLFFGLLQVPWPGRTLLSEGSTGGREYLLSTGLGRFLSDLIDTIGFRAGARTELRQISLEERERQLASRRHIEYIHIGNTVSSPTVEGIEDGVEAIDTAIRGVGGGGTRIEGRARAPRLVLEMLTGVPS